MSNQTEAYAFRIKFTSIINRLLDLSGKWTILSPGLDVSAMRSDWEIQDLLKHITDVEHIFLPVLL